MKFLQFAQFRDVLCQQFAIALLRLAERFYDSGPFVERELLSGLQTEVVGIDFHLNTPILSCIHSPHFQFADLRQVLAVLVDVQLVLDELVLHLLLQVGALASPSAAGDQPRLARGGSGRGRSAPACRRPS